MSVPEEIERAKALDRVQDYHGALAQLDTALSRADWRPEWYLYRAYVHAKLKNSEAAKADVVQFTRLNPEWPKNKPKLSGYMKKDKQKVIASAQRRYFFLKNKFLWYYKSPLDNEPINGICLEGMVLETSIPNKKHSFRLEIPGNTWIMDALGEQAYRNWIKALAETSTEDVWSIVVQPMQVPLSDPIPPQRQITLSGYLFKRGFQHNSWKQRWFELQNDLLSYYETPTAKPKGTIDLKNAKLFMEEDEKDKFCFQIMFEHRTYFLYATTAEDRTRWLEALAKVPSVDSSALRKPRTSKTVTTASSPTIQHIPTTTRIVIEQPVKESTRKIGPEGPPNPAIPEEENKLITPSEIDDARLRTGITQHEEEERRRNEEAKKRARESPAPYNLVFRSRSEELRERLLESEFEEEERESRFEQCCRCTIL